MVPVSYRSDLKTAAGRMAARQPAIHHQRGAVHVARIVRGEEQSRAGDVFGFSAALERVELTDAAFPSRCAREFVKFLGHSSLDQSWADRVHPNAASRELLAGGLDQADHAGFGS